MQYLYYFYPGMFVLGILVSYTDIRYNTIKNKHLVFALIYGLFIYLYIFFIKHSNIPVGLLILNILAGICIAYILYLTRLWSAGDAKLFITLSFLTPSSKYIYLFKLPTLSLFINISIVSLTCIIILDSKNIFMNIRHISATNFKKELYKFFYSLLIIFSITWIIWFLFSKINFSEPFLAIAILYLFYFLIFRVVEKLRSRKLLLVFVLSFGIIIRLLIQPQIFFSLAKMLEYLTRTLKYTIIFSLLNIFFIVRPTKDNNKSVMKINIAFAPLMFLGAITVESPFIHLILNLLRLLRT